jgi:two-component sensor histidine kinase
MTLRAWEITAEKNPTDFEALLRQSVGAPGGERLRCEGPDVHLASSRVLAIQIFHDLTANAVKHGALSVPGGEIGVTWALEPDARSGRT